MIARYESKIRSKIIDIMVYLDAVCKVMFRRIKYLQILVAVFLINGQRKSVPEKHNRYATSAETNPTHG